MSTSSRLKDGVLLLCVGIAVSAISWTFWHFLGADWGGLVLVALVMSGLARENRRLRKQLTKEQGSRPS